uniref:C-type isolectin Sp-CL4-like n=1 Tax=Doryrhamphus excisus TaxID=161450 RepID=UPI0025ADFC6E|nr:C-type isolectin Sp-CL4-like [Doryrhamphus excisus]
MPSAVTTVLLMGALMVAPAFAQTYDHAGVRAMCADVQLQACGNESCGFYRLNEYSCVKVLTMQRTFPNAQRECELANGNLVTVLSQQEQDRLLCMMLKVFPQRLHYWVGALRGEDGDFYWVDGSGPVVYGTWGPGQPDSFSPEEKCVWINSGIWGLWNDGPCYEKNSVACQVMM